jgi:hypothetical protein
MIFLVRTWVPRAENIARCDLARKWLTEHRQQLGELGVGFVYNPEVNDPGDPPRKPRLTLRRFKRTVQDPLTGKEFEQFTSEYQPTVIDDYESVLLQMWWNASRNRTDFVLVNEDVLPRSVEPFRQLLACPRLYCRSDQAPWIQDRFCFARFRHELSEIQAVPSWEPPHPKFPGRALSRLETWLGSMGVDPHVHPGLELTSLPMLET